jgi:hypothetical protein
VTLPDVHLAGEAVAAYVDDALSPTARDRAHRHLRSCAECRAVIDAQREAKVLLAASFDPELPAGLLARLRDIPMTADFDGADLGQAGTVLAVDGHELGWARESSHDVQFARHPAPVGAPMAASAVPVGLPGGTGWHRLGAVLGQVAADAAGSRPAGVSRRDAAERGGRPESYPSGPAGARSARRRRNRRLAGALAGLAFGVIASAASTGAGGGSLPAQRGGVGPAVDTTRLVVDRGPASGGPLDAGTVQVGGSDQRRANLLTVVGTPR